MSRTVAAVTSLLLVASLFAMAAPGGASTGATDGSSTQGTFVGTQDASMGAQGTYAGIQGAYVGTQGAYAGTQATYASTQGTYADTQDVYVGAQGAYAGTQDAYAGTHVAFDVEGDAVADFAVDGTTAFDEVRVQSQSAAGIGIGVGLGAVANIDGAALSMSAETETSATVATESGAALSAHDTERGHLLVAAGGEAQFVEAELAAGATAEADGEAVVVDTGDREGAFVVVGEGDVAVNDEGNVVADLGADATLVFRSYAAGERDDAARVEESLVAEGAAAVEVHVEKRAEGVVSEAVTFGAETSAEVESSADNRVELTIDRTVHEGTIVLTTVSEAAVGSVDDLEVTVDGEVAAEASSRAALEAAADGEEPRYMVASRNEADGEATVYVAIDHFSERTVAMSGGGEDAADDDAANDGSSGDGSNGDDESIVGDALPGFGALAALVSAVLTAAARVR